MRRLLDVVTYVVLFLLILGFSSSLSRTAMASSLVASVTGADPAAAPGAELHLEGRAPVLWPGHRTTLEVLITNTSGDGALRVTAVDVEVSAASPTCLAENVAVTDYAYAAGLPPVVVQPGKTVVLPLPLTMLETGANQDSCQGVSFPLEFTASAHLSS